MGLLDDWWNWRQGNASSLRDATTAGAEATMTALRGGLLSDAEREALVNTPAAWLGTDPMGKAGRAAGLLDMSPDARAARAAEQGYVWDAYHGTTSDIGAFDLSRVGSANDKGFFGEGLYFSPNPDVANQYAHSILHGDASNVIPAKLKMANPFIYPTRKTHGDSYKAALEEESARLGYKLDASINSDPAGLTKALKAAGHDGVVVLNRSGADEYVVFDPTQVRSRFAAFDPARVNDPDLLAAYSPGALNGLLTPADDERKR